MPTPPPWYDELSTPRHETNGRCQPDRLQGHFQFKEARDLHIYIRLMHARISKFNKRDHSLSPFYAPTPGQLQEDAWDIAMRFPVKSR